MIDMVTLKQCIQTNLDKEWVTTPPSDDCFDKDEENMKDLIDYTRYLDSGNIANFNRVRYDSVRDHLVQCIRCRHVYGIVRGYV